MTAPGWLRVPSFGQDGERRRRGTEQQALVGGARKSRPGCPEEGMEEVARGEGQEGQKDKNS